VYDGTSNVLIDISYNNNDWWSSGKCMATIRGTLRTFYGYCDSLAGDPLRWGDPAYPPYTGGTVYDDSTTYTPNIRLYK
jgi:hypothetical protein